MKKRWSLLVLLVLCPAARAEGPAPAPSCTTGPVVFPLATADAPSFTFTGEGPPCSQGGPLAGNHNFRNFINFISNPLQNIDPRAVTAIYPLFISSWVNNTPPLPDANAQVLGPAITLALTDRLAVGINQGGYAFINASRNQFPRLAALDPLGRFRTVEIGGERDGFLNIGGFVQYTFIEDVPNQFLVTGGLRWEAPCGSYEVFQGHGPLHLAPYLTLGKELGDFHVLATAGYEFPAGPGNDTSQLFYANFHLDRRFGCLYPLVELNRLYHTTSVTIDRPLARGFFNFDNFESSGNIVSLAAGMNAVLVPERLEIGAAYTTVIASQHNFDANGVIVKMVLRF